MGQPLDPAKAFFYGQFVQAAYTMFRNPQGGDPLRPEPAGIPDGWELGAWILMSDFILTVKEPEFYGIVVHEINNPDSRIIAIRGTEGPMEWADDAAAIPIPFHQVPLAGLVAVGFDTIYKSLRLVKRILPSEGAQKETANAAPETFAGSFADQLDQLAATREATRGETRSVEERERPKRPTVVTGHSLGGALTTLFVMENASKHAVDIQTSCTFASPLVGNKEFAQAFGQLAIDSWRIVNTLDLVPKLPPLGYQHVALACEFRPEYVKHNPVCWHAMETYLHWLDNTLKVRPECVPGASCGGWWSRLWNKLGF
jgi:hypothetical protein